MPPIIAKDNQKEYPLAPQGLFQAVCVDVVDLGLVKDQYGEKHKVQLRWQLDMESDDGQRFMVAKRYTNSLNEKARLRAHLESWRGQKFSPEELKGFDLEKLIGVNCQIQIVHSEDDKGRTWANVSTVVALGKGMTKMRASDSYVRVIDRTSQPVPVAAEADDDAIPF